MPDALSTTIGRIERRWTSADGDPYDDIEWERRDARMTNWQDGSIAFEQADVEFPADWSINASNIVAQKYFRGRLGTAARESSLRQVVDRIVLTIAEWAVADGHVLDGEEQRVFADELRWLLVRQRAAFNSPVWFNIGVEGVPQQASACFILSVDDSLDSILGWYRDEGVIFQGGSGAGANLSRLRGSMEALSNGGTASGPVSFMRGADASAGAVKSGGTTRRAAKMVMLDIDHPDIEEFVGTKAHEERKIRALRDAGFDMSLDGDDMRSVQFQNANNSVRVTDEFMRAVRDDTDWTLTARTTGLPIRTLRARDLWQQMNRAAWECADPGVQFDTTINRWHTTPNAGRINGSNPCFPGSARVHTDRGLVRFDDLIQRVNVGEQFRVWTHDVTAPDAPAQQVHLTEPEAFAITGRNPIQRLRFSNGAELRCTPNHGIFTTNRGFVAAEELTSDDHVRTLDLPTPAESADALLPVSTDARDDWTSGDRKLPLELPEAWTPEFAHYLGWLIGDGSTSGPSTATIYGSAEDRVEILPGHQELLQEINGGRPLKPSEQQNGTVQLRLSRRSFKRFVESLGVRSVTGEHKTVPWSIEQAPPEIGAAFLRGLFDADGCVVDNPKKGSYVGLGSISIDLLRGAQRLLTTFGIHSRIYHVKKRGTKEFSYRRADGSTATYTSKDSFDLRITSKSLERFAGSIGFGLSRKATLLASVISVRSKGFYDVDTTARLVERIDEGIELTYNLSEPRNHSYVVDGIVVRNCSEYFHLDDSACNLASLNLLAFLDDDGGFDVEGFRHAVRLLITAQDVLVGRADYPTERIGETSRDFRQLGLGYANLGAMLMALGLPYDSDEGRAWAAAVTSLMTGTAYETSAALAARLTPFRGFDADAEGMRRVLELHRAAAGRLADERTTVPDDLVRAGNAAWDEAVRSADHAGVRNAQVTVLAPTGTIGLAMDCDTTGIEPDLGLVKTKRLVGGGSMTIVNHTVPRALRALGYPASQIDDIVAHLDEHQTVVGAPHLHDEHLAVFACSMGDLPIAPDGHVRMMAAVQPLISGGISKTVNLGADVTVDDVAAIHELAWELGVKSISIYRDQCKVGQPLSTGTTEEEDVEDEPPTGSVHPPSPPRRRLPRNRRSRTFEFRVADCKGFATIGEYDDGQPGEIFLTVSKQGSTMSGIMDAFAKSISYGLQYGVPLRAFVGALTNMRFEPAGMTDDPDLRIASSIMDYLFRRLALDYLPVEERAELGIFSTTERTQPTLPGIDDDGVVEEVAAGHEPPAFEVIDLADQPAAAGSHRHDAPMCMQCGVTMVRAGSCHVCPDCGTSSGCS